MNNDTTKLLQALNQVQKELKPVEKTRLNPHFKSKFADLTGVLEEVLPILAKNDLVLIQTIGGEDSNPTLDTIIAHAPSGQSIKSTAPLFCKQPTSQELGSAITYMRRYSLMAIIGVSTVEEDDDGQKASIPGPQARPNTQSQVRQPQPMIRPSTEQVKNAIAGVPNAIPKELPNMAPGQSQGKLTDKQIARLYAISRTKWTKQQVIDFCQSFYKTIPELLTKQQYDEACDFVGKNGPTTQEFKQLSKEIENGPPDYLNDGPPFDPNEEIPF